MENVYLDESTAASYNKARDLPPETFRLWMNVVLSSVPKEAIRKILDLGCGTGAWAVPLRDAFESRVIGIDPSSAMLNSASSMELQGVEWKLGTAESIPAESQDFDLVWLSAVIHHFPQPLVALQEIGRVLRPNGFLVIRNATKELIDRVEWLKYFPDAVLIDKRRLLFEDELLDLAKRENFELVSKSTVTAVVASLYSAYYEKVAGRALSALKMISDEAFDKGLTRMQEEVKKRFDDSPVFESHGCFIFKKAFTT